MLKVNIVALNSKYIHSSLAIYYLKAGVKAYAKSEIKLSLFEYTIHTDLEKIATELLENKPDLIGLSTYIWNVEYIYSLVSLLKGKEPSVKILLGGPEVSYNQKEVLSNHPLVDYILSGEGELPFAELCDALNLKTDLKDVKGLSFKEGKDYYIQEAYISNSDPVDPYDEEFLAKVNGRIVYFETTRGCPYSCDFCLSGRCGNVRFFNLENAYKQLIKLANSGTKTIKFVDRTFNANRKRSKEIIQFIIGHHGSVWPSDVTFHFEIAGDILDDETIELLKSAPIGLFQLEIGMQSFHEPTLAYINRKTNTDVLKRNILKLLEGQNMHIHIDLIVGLAFEGMKELRDSFNTAYHLNAHMLQLGFLKILHGAAYENKEKYELTYDKNSPYEVIETPWLNQEEMLQIHHLEDVLDRMNNSGRFLRTIDYLLKVTEMTPFDLLLNFGEYASSRMTYKIVLDEYTALIYDYFSTLEGVDPEALRDEMVLDRLSTINTGRLPQCLKRQDSRIKRFRLILEEEIKEEKGVKRAFEILYSKGQIVYCDYKEKNRITGQYDLHLKDLNDFESDC